MPEEFLPGFYNVHMRRGENQVQTCKSIKTEALDSGTALVLEYQDGNIEVAPDLISQYIGMVYEIIRKMKIYGSYEEVDCLHEGVLEILISAKSFDIREGVCFSTFVYPNIRQKIHYILRSNSRTIHIPHNQEADWARMGRIEAELMVVKGRQPSREEVAEEANISPVRVDTLRRTFSLREHVRSMEIETEDGDTLHDVIADSSSTSPFEMIIAKELRETVTDAFSILDKRERLVIERRFGFKTGCIQTQHQIGQHLGISGSMVEKIQRRSLAKVKERLQGEDLGPH